MLYRSTGSSRVLHDQGLFTVNAVSKVTDPRAPTTSDLKWTDRCAAADQKNRCKVFRLNSTLRQVGGVLYKAIVRPYLEYCAQAQPPFSKKETACPKQV